MWVPGPVSPFCCLPFGAPWFFVVEEGELGASSWVHTKRQATTEKFHIVPTIRNESITHCPHWNHYLIHSEKNPRVRKLFVRNSGAGNGCANYMDAWKNAFFLQEKNPCP